MFKIAATPTYKSKVTVDFPGDNGKTVSKVFTAIFKRLSQSELDSLSERVNAGELKDNDVIREVMVGWGDDVGDESGAPLEFNEQNLVALLDLHPVRPTIVKAYYATINGAKAKN